ncbi:MAG: hypothetical protein CMD47_04700 [Gammaproteobacteria bacterium]|nr:hypothetical protein [Gammaproteobacteria bacterium]
MKNIKNHINQIILNKAQFLSKITNFLNKNCTFCENVVVYNIYDHTIVIGVHGNEVISKIKNYEREIIKDINFNFKKSLDNKEIKKIKFKKIISDT